MSKDKQFIPKSKGKKPTKLQIAEQQSDIPKDLQDKWSAVEAAATTFNLLQSGSFTYSYSKALGASLAFVRALHENCVEDALKHPYCHLIPELNAILKQRAEDGKKEADEALSGKEEA